MFGSLVGSGGGGQLRPQLGDQPPPPLALEIEVVDAGVLVSVVGGIAGSELGPHDGLHERTARFHGAGGGRARVEGVAGDEEDGAGARDAVGARGDVQCDDGRERGDGLCGGFGGRGVQGEGGGAFGRFLLLLLARELFVQHVPDLRGQVGQDVAVLREEEGFAFGHAAGGGQLHGRHGFAGQDVARVGELGFQFGDALDEGGGVDEPLAQDGVVDLGAGGVALLG